MAAALRAAEGGYIFSKSSGGYFQNFSGQGGIPPYPLFPTPGYIIAKFVKCIKSELHTLTDLRGIRGEILKILPYFRRGIKVGIY